MSEVAEIEENQPPEPRRTGRRGSAATNRKPARKAIPPKVQNVVWGRAAGRCQYAGCNKLLIGEQISGARNANNSYIAHVVGDSPEGPRGDPILSPKLAHDPDNLMLVCDEHHRVIDREMVDAHSVDVLREMKSRHETRIRIVGGIDEDLGSHVIRYAAKIGANESPVEKGAVKWSMIPDRYPLDGGWIDLDLVTLELRDDDPDFWPTHVKNLRTVFNEKVRGRMERQEIKRLAVFGLAPIPLLFELGRLISDIPTADVRQLLRDPKGWKWDTASAPVRYEAIRPTRIGGPVALKLEISAPVADGRVTNVLGPDTAIWSIAADGAHNDIVRRPEDIAAFAKLFRKTLDDIKLAHGEDVAVNIFPAVPVSIAVEAGRSWQPKAHPSLTIYDQNWKLGGFALALRLEHAC
ncbi:MULTISPECIES: SAVED domain-containing protein [unclassified Bradyrhizobium]|uniref:SAVED domain-containing protein n=1 Tax=unclassified Bradyrhizobium TaxID=2631580 RepID=UPI00247AB7F9|nr:MULTISPECIES: SAVED domain-containing protein [unclassified Bradyrhizobium]WGS17597.1 SAVED domain-containing protein [Bradyrhizobium sp. ISRA463]WGS24380.1 SAVED domain-containing protein [Bradyrhizobium sp. ISRA464]